MPRRRSSAVAPEQKAVEQYNHRGKKRANNPPVGLVTPETDRDEPRKAYAFDPHLDPRLDWSGKAERTSFEVPTVSLHVHERIDPRTILEAIRRKETGPIQASLFQEPAENPPLREALDFYKHPHGWTNRLIAGDSLLVMNSLLEKEGLGGQAQMIYIDPPYGVRYGSNFQPFVNKRDVKDGQDSDLTREPEMVRAFRDTWQLGIHSYLTYLRDRLLLCRSLLHESGSLFVQIGDANLHLVRAVLDEVFGSANFVSVVSFQKTAGLSSPLARVNTLASVADYLVWYARDLPQIKYRQLYRPKEMGGEGSGQYTWLQEGDGTERPLRPEERAGRVQLPDGGRIFAADNLQSPGHSATLTVPFEFEGRVFQPSANSHWKTTKDGLKRLSERGRLKTVGNGLYYKRFIDDFPVFPLTNVWSDTSSSFSDKVYVVQTVPKIIQRALLMTTDPGDLVLDPTCGSGTTAVVAEQRGRRWITCDTSRVAVTLAKQRLMTSAFDYYELAHPDEGVASGFVYRSVPHVTLGALANDEPVREEALYDQPVIDRSRVRVSGPFTVEAVPAPVVRPVEDLPEEPADDASVARSGETLRQAEWRAHLLRAGMRGRAGAKVEFSRIEPQGGTRYLNAVGETSAAKPQAVAISFGPEHAPLEQRQVELAWEEARGLSPRPDIIVFAAFQFDPEAAKDIDELDPKKTGMTFLRVQMDPDLLVDDLRKKSSADHSFWLIGQPDVQLRRANGKFKVEVAGFDYYDPRSGAIDSGDTSKIAMWLLDTDYDGRSLLPRQVFFPMAGEKDGWSKLAKDLKAVLDEELLETYRGTTSLPFEAGPHKRAAVKIIDDRGIESLKLLELE
jgi:adenine-specific DNA-methyltransferase